MGQHAEDIMNGDVDRFTGEWIGNGQGFSRCAPEPRDTKKFSKSTKAIRKELAILIKKTIKDNPEGIESKIVNDCRQIINTKYGKGWREQWANL